MACVGLATGRVAAGAAAGVVALLAVLALAGRAEAATLTYEENITGIAANTSDDVSVPCPQGTKVVSGGVYLSGSSLEIEVRSSAPYASQGGSPSNPKDGWSGIGNAGPLSESLRAYAICVDGARLRYEKDAKMVKPGKRGRTNADCDGGWKVLGGGVKTSFSNPSTDIVLVQSAQAGVADGVDDNDGWSGIVANGSAEKVKTTTWATCGKCVKQRINTVYNGVPVFLNNTQDQLTTVSCDTGFQVTGGGGVVIGAPAGTEIATLEPRDTDADNVRDDAWRTWFNNQSGANQAMSAFAICSKFR